MNGTPAPTVRYAALIWHPFLDVTIHAANMGWSVDLSTSEFLKHPHASGFFAVYDSIEALRRDYPKAPVAEINVHPAGPENAFSGVNVITKDASEWKPMQGVNPHMN